MALSKRLRFEILRRDNHQCRYCGGAAPDVPLRVDHVVPVALGGSDDPSNLVTACEPCNSGKSSIAPDAPILEDVAADALRWSRAMDLVAEVRRRERIERMEVKFWFGVVWEQWVDRNDNPFVVPDDALDSVTRFLAAGLDRPQMEELVRVAMVSLSRDKWRYFCGCCWRRLRENADMARDILNAEEA